MRKRVLVVRSSRGCTLEVEPEVAVGRVFHDNNRPVMLCAMRDLLAPGKSSLVVNNPFISFPVLPPPFALKPRVSA